MIKIHLPLWLNKGEVKKLAIVFEKFWQQVYSWLSWPLSQIDPLTCSEALLNLLAYQRDITRFSDEPLALYRLRVKHAFINAQDAGSITGFAAVFERLGVGKIEQLERQPDYNWDVIIIRVSDQQIAENNTLMMSLIRQYGRTCRRYIFQIVNDSVLTISGGWFGGDFQYYSAQIDIQPGAISMPLTVLHGNFHHHSSVFTASL